ncbi:MAG: alpha/beta hydrolase [Dehalococcoidia bacterium]
MPIRTAFVALTLLGLVIFPGGAAAAPAAQQPTYRVRVTRDLVYGSGDTVGGPMALQADLYVPVDASGPLPAFVAIHGGGFTQGDKRQANWVQLCRALAAQGTVCLSINYRLEGDDPISPGPTRRARAVTAAVEDATSALRYLHAQASQLGVDRTRIAIGGGSAGAASALFAAYLDGPDRPAVAAVVDLWGSLGDRVDLIGPGDPPVLVVHGTEDPLVPFGDGEAIVARAKQVGVPVTFIPVEGAGHGVRLNQPVGDKTLMEAILGFLGAGR